MKIYQLHALFFIVIAGMLITGCQSDSKKIPGNLKYYNLQGLFENQITILKQKNAKAYKRTKLDEEGDASSIDHIDWQKELQPFIQADINKPAYVNSYRITKPDSNTVIYTKVSKDNLLVQELTIKSDSTDKSPLEVRARLRSKNQLYRSDRELVAIFSKGVLKSYSVSGFQKLAMLNQRNFRIEVTIR